MLKFSNLDHTRESIGWWMSNRSYFPKEINGIRDYVRYQDYPIAASISDRPLSSVPVG
jgi:hypothetical protein